MTSCRWLALLLCASTAHAAPATPLDAFSMRVAGMMARFDTDIRVVYPDGDVESVDFDRELGLEDNKLIESFAVNWRPAMRHEFGIDYFNESLKGTRRLGRDIRLEGETFPFATTVQSRFTLEAFEFHYTYWPVQSEHWAAGMRFGLVDYRVRTHLRMLLGERGEPPEVSVEATVSEDIPAPTFGADFRYAPTPRWRFSFNVGWFEAKFKRVSPIIVTTRAGAEWLLFDDLGVWVDYGMSHLDADYRSSSFRGGLEIREGGLRIGVIWRM